MDPKIVDGPYITEIYSLHPNGKIPPTTIREINQLLIKASSEPVNPNLAGRLTTHQIRLLEMLANNQVTLELPEGGGVFLSAKLVQGNMFAVWIEDNRNVAPQIFQIARDGSIKSTGTPPQQLAEKFNAIFRYLVDGVTGKPPPIEI